MRACLVTASPRLARLVPDLYMLPLTSTRNRNCFFSPSLEWGSPARDALGVGMRATCEQSFRVSSRLGGGPALRGVCTRCAPRPATKEEVDIKPKQSQIRILSSTARSLQVLSWNLHSHSLTHSLTRSLPPRAPRFESHKHVSNCVQTIAIAPPTMPSTSFVSSRSPEVWCRSHT